MDFAPLHGWMKNGPQWLQKFDGWLVYAHEPKNEAATAVVLMTESDYEMLTKWRGPSAGTSE